MKLLSSLVQPRRTMHRLLEAFVRGKRSRLLEQIPFVSGLGDSAWILYGLARSLRPEVCVEIGSARGKSACFVGQALKENGKGKLYAIDPHAPTEWNDINSVDTYEVMRGNLETIGVVDRVEIVRKTSEQAALSWNSPIDLLFIDGDHSYKGVKKDWDLFTPHMSPFGVVVFHDTTWEIDPANRHTSSRDDMGVPRFVEELRSAGLPVITLPRDFGVSILQARPGGIPLILSTEEAESSGDRQDGHSKDKSMFEFANSERATK